MDNRTRRTILRKANTSDVNSVTESQFNMYQFTGLNDSNNYATVDQTSFSDANNVYVDTDNELTSRPPVKYTEIFKELLLPSDEIEAIYQSNGTIFYLSNHKLYWKWGDEENCVEDLYAEDEDGTIHYYTRFKIIWINDMYIVFEQYTDTVSHTSLFGLQYIDGKWIRRDVYELLYIPRKDYLTDTWLESKNILCDAEIMQYIFDGNDANMENISLRLAGDTFEIEVHDETIEVTWQKHYTDVLITKINSALYEYTFDSHQCTASGSTILLYTEGERTGWISRDMGQSWSSVIFAPSVDTEAKCTVCLADNADYDTLFVIFNELHSRDAELAPCFRESNYEIANIQTYYVTLYKGVFATDTNNVTWYDGTDIVVCDNDTPFSSLKFGDVFDPDSTTDSDGGYLYNGMGDKSLFSKESWWSISKVFGAMGNYPYVTGIVSYAGDNLRYGGYRVDRYVKMHAPDGQHCVVLFPVNGYIQHIIPYNFHTATETNSGITFDSTYHHAYLDYIRNSTYNYTYILPSPLLINYYCRSENEGVYNDIHNKNMTALVYYNEEKGLYTHTLGVSGEDRTFRYTDTEGETKEAYYNTYDATFFEGGRICYVPVGEGNYEVVFSFNQSGGSYAIISLAGNTATDLRADINVCKNCATGSQSYGTGGAQYYFSLNTQIQYRYQTASYEPGTALFYYTREETTFPTYDEGTGTVDVSFLSIFQPIKNICDEEDITVTDDVINELFRYNSKSMPKAAGDAFANFQDAMSEIFNIYVNDEGSYINLAVLKDLDINTKLNDLLNTIPDANATMFMRMPQLIEEVEDNASETDKTTLVYIEGDTTSDCISAVGSRTYYYINNVASLKNTSDWESYFVNHLAYSTPITTTHRQILTHLFLHSFYDTNVDDWMENDEWTSDTWSNTNRPSKNDLDIGATHTEGYDLFDVHYDTNCLRAYPYMSFNTIEKDIESFSVKTQMLTNTANEVILDKTLSHLFFVTDKYLYNGEYYLFDDPVVDYFWLTDTFEFTPLAILYNTYFIGLNSHENNNEVYCSYFAYFGETFTVETTTIRQLTIDIPDFDAVAYNSTSLTYNNLLYQTSVGGTDEYEDTGYKKLYIPENTKVTLPHNITAMVAFSQTVMGIFTEHTAYEYTYDTDYGYYMLFPTKLTLGNRSGYDITEALSGDRIYMSTVFGFSALAYENFVQSTEQQLTRVDSNIDTIFRNFDMSPVKIVAYNYWTILYRQDSKEILLFDARTSSWWKWTLPFEPDLMYRDGRTLYLFDQDKNTVYQMDFDSEECKDYNGDVIDWNFVSQKLHFGGVTYYKHINNLTVMATPKTNKLRYKLEFKNFHNGYDIDSDITVEYYIETVGNCIKKMNFMKTNAMQFKISLDDTDEYPSKFRMSNISIKYRITEKIR